jgi:two-component system CheB/CheR fusion protein
MPPSLDRVTVDDIQAGLLGLPEAGEYPGANLFDQVVDEDRQELRSQLQACVHDGREITVETRVSSGTDQRPRWLRSLARPVGGERQMRILGVSFDVTADRYRAESRELMIGEMNHRVKNLFAVISALVSTMSRKATSAEQLARDLRASISSLGRAHALTNRPDETDGLTLGALVRAVLKPFASQFDVTISGPEVSLDQESITPIALILHECSTNAVKYGVFAGAGGQLEIFWTDAPDEGWSLCWRETLAEDIDATASSPGFGSHLMQIAARQLQAELDNRSVGNIYEWCLTRSHHEDS